MGLRISYAFLQEAERPAQKSDAHERLQVVVGHPYAGVVIPWGPENTKPSRNHQFIWKSVEIRSGRRCENRRVAIHTMAERRLHCICIQTTARCGGSTDNDSGSVCRRLYQNIDILPVTYLVDELATHSNLSHDIYLLSEMSGADSSAFMSLKGDGSRLKAFTRTRVDQNLYRADLRILCTRGVE